GIRRNLEKRYGSDQVHQGGLRVYTSLDTDLQNTAKQAVLDGVAAYERRHGWKNNLRNVVKEGANLKSYSHPDWDEPIAVNGYEHALVTGVSGSTATVRLGEIQRHTGAAGCRLDGQARLATLQARRFGLYQTADAGA